MANKGFYRVQAVDREVKVVNFKSSITGSNGAVTATTGSGVTVTKAGTTYRAVTDQGYGQVLAAHLQVEAAAAGISAFVTGTLDSTSGIVFGLASGTLSQTPAANCVVHGMLLLKNATKNQH